MRGSQLDFHRPRRGPRTCSRLVLHPANEHDHHHFAADDNHLVVHYDRARYSAKR